MATIIKRGSHTPAPAGEQVTGVAFDLEELSTQGDRYLDKVRSEAAKIVQQANVEAQRIRKEAEQAGRQAAEQAIDQVMAEKVEQRMQTLRPAIEGIVSTLDSQRSGWLAHWEASAIDLAVQIAERIVRREVAQRPEVTVEWAREALAMVAGGSEVVVRLNPTDHANLADSVETVASTFTKIARAEVVADESVQPGGCVVETEHGVIDAQVETQIARMLEELT